MTEERFNELWSKASRYPHPGKFEGELNMAQYFYVLSLDSEDEGFGDCSTVGWYASFMKGSFEPTPKEINEYSLNESDVEIIKNLYGVVVTINDQGFVSVQYAEDEAQYNMFLEQCTADESYAMEDNEYYGH